MFSRAVKSAPYQEDHQGLPEDFLCRAEASDPQDPAAPHQGSPLRRSQRGAPDQGDLDKARARQVLAGAEDSG